MECPFERRCVASPLPAFTHSQTGCSTRRFWVLHWNIGTELALQTSNLPWVAFSKAWPAGKKIVIWFVWTDLPFLQSWDFPAHTTADAMLTSRLHKCLLRKSLCGQLYASSSQLAINIANNNRIVLKIILNSFQLLNCWFLTERCLLQNRSFQFDSCMEYVHSKIALSLTSWCWPTHAIRTSINW